MTDDSDDLDDEIANLEEELLRLQVEGAFPSHLRSLVDEMKEEGGYTASAPIKLTLALLKDSLYDRAPRDLIEFVRETIEGLYRSATTATITRPDVVQMFDQREGLLEVLDLLLKDGPRDAWERFEELFVERIE